jgi:hypothetical protein
MSVKDQLEQYHIDGSHTTVKSKRSNASSVLSEFNKEAAWNKQAYSNYEGGNFRSFPTCLFSLFSVYALKETRNMARCSSISLSLRLCGSCCVNFRFSILRCVALRSKQTNKQEHTL